MSNRIIHDVVLSVAPGEVDDPQRAKRFILTWWEKKTGWLFCHKSLGEEGRALIEKAPSDPEVLALILREEDIAIFEDPA